MSMHDDWLEMEQYLAGLDDKPEWSDYEPEKRVRIPSYWEEGLYESAYEDGEVGQDKQEGSKEKDDEVQ